MTASNFEFLKGNIEIIILNSLYSGDKYGYEIAKEVKDKTENAYEIKQPTLYSYLKRLEQGDLIEAYWGEESSGGRRKYYRLTNEGRKVCVDFTSEWKFQQTVINNLVADDENIKPVTQQEATPLFGNKVKKNKKERRVTNVVEQQQLGTQLDMLLNYKNDEPTESAENAPVEETLTRQEDTVSAPTQQKVDTIPEQFPYEAVEQPPKTYVYREPVSQEDFLREFNTKAQEIIEKTTTYEVPPEQDAYKDIFDTPAKKEEVSIIVGGDEPKNPAALQETAEELLSEGIKIRLYSPESAKYSPQPMLYSNKITCINSWLTYFTFAVEALICWLCAMKVIDMTVVVVFWLVGLVFPAVTTALYFSNPTKKTKPKFDFKYHLVNTLITAGILIILIFSLNILLFQTNFTDARQVVDRIVLPIIVSVNLPTYIVYYKLLYKKMLV